MLSKEPEPLRNTRIEDLGESEFNMVSAVLVYVILICIFLVLMN